MNELFILTGLLAFWYIICIARTIHSDIPTFGIAHHRTFFWLLHQVLFLGQQKLRVDFNHFVVCLLDFSYTVIKVAATATAPHRNSMSLVFTIQQMNTCLVSFLIHAFYCDLKRRRYTFNDRIMLSFYFIGHYVISKYGFFEVCIHCRHQQKLSAFTCNNWKTRDFCIHYLTHRYFFHGVSYKRRLF